MCPCTAYSFLCQVSASTFPCAHEPLHSVFPRYVMHGCVWLSAAERVNMCLELRHCVRPLSCLPRLVCAANFLLDLPRRDGHHSRNGTCVMLCSIHRGVCRRFRSSQKALGVLFSPEISSLSCLICIGSATVCRHVTTNNCLSFHLLLFFCASDDEHGIAQIKMRWDEMMHYRSGNQESATNYNVASYHTLSQIYKRNGSAFPLIIMNKFKYNCNQAKKNTTN